MALAPGSPSSFNIAPGFGDSDAMIRRRYALSLMQQAGDASPVQHPLQAAARAIQGAMGGYMNYSMGQEDEADKAKARELLSRLSGGPSAEQPPTAPASPQAMPSPDMSQPRGLRNNNPLNIEAGGFTQSQPGFAGSDGRFAKFASLDQGVGAAGKLLNTYSQKHGLNTVAGIVGRWAPASDGNNVSAYATNVAKQMGVDPNAPLDMSKPDVKQALILAMGQHENGRPIQMAQAQMPTPNPPPGGGVAQPNSLRGGMTPQYRSDLINQLSQTRAGAPYAQHLFMKQMDQEAGAVRPLNEREKQTYPGAVAVKADGTPIFPPPSTNVSLNAQNTGESAYSKGKAEDALTLERSSDAAVAERQKLEVFKSLVSDFKTGKLAPAQSTVGAWADALGIDAAKLGLPKNAAVNGQLIESMTNQMTLGMIGAKGGEGGMPANNFSDADRSFLSKTAPGLSRMQGGNQVLAEMKARSLDRQLDKISMWDQYRSDGKKYEDFERDWRKKVRSEPSLFADIPEMIKGLTQQPQASPQGPARGGAQGAIPEQAGPPPAAIEALRANPQRQQEFDAKFGPGSSARVLGGT